MDPQSPPAPKGAKPRASRAAPGSRMGRLRDMVWPRMGLRRYGAYLRKRILRLQATPHAIGAGVASGAAVSMLPLIGLHFLLGFVLAFVTRGNMIAAAIGTAWGNPFTFPVFFSASYALGSLILGGPAGGETAQAAAEQLDAGLFSGGFAAAWPAFKTMFVGGLPLAVLVYGGFYLAVRWTVTRYRAARRARQAERRARRTARTPE